MSETCIKTKYLSHGIGLEAEMVDEGVKEGVHNAILGGKSPPSTISLRHERV